MKFGEMQQILQVPVMRCGQWHSVRPRVSDVASAWVTLSGRSSLCT